jgi:hypothetical protein
MYRHCIYCSADLKSNEAIEGFPIGRTVAFDAAKGRLWAVCGKCGRWNLAPLEERWEPLEQAEKVFRDTRQRVQSENIGLSRFADGTGLVRIGAALTGELAAWRYGDEMVRRHRRGTWVALVGAGVGTVLMGPQGLAAMAVMWGATVAARSFWGNKPVFPTQDSEDVQGQLRMRHLTGIRTDVSENGLVQLDVARFCTPEGEKLPVRFEGARALTLLRRSLARRNRAGAPRRQVDAALKALEGAGSADRFILNSLAGGRRIAIGESAVSEFEQVFIPDWAIGLAKSAGGILGRGRPRIEPVARPLPGQHIDLLALEAALSDDQERRALAGELAALQSAWREAEEIAGIADRLAIAPGEG